MNVMVSDAKSAGIYVYNVAGSVAMNHCKFANASSDKPDTVSGNVIMYDTLTRKDTSLVLTDSLIVDSGYRCDDYYWIYSSGLAVFLGSLKLTLNIVNTNFSNNRGCYGGNIGIIFFDFATVTISHTNFNDGYSLLGGGMHVSFKNSYLNKAYRNISYSNLLSITESTFTRNIGNYVAGGIYLNWKKSLKVYGSTYIKITNTSFDGNGLGAGGSGGMALGVHADNDVSEDPYSFLKFHVNVDVSNCSFANHNQNQFTDGRILLMNSVIEAETVPYLGIHGITMRSNNCTAIRALGSKLVFSGSTKISNNTAVTGAGFQLTNSLLFLTQNTDLVITNNSVLQTGGGLLINSYSDCVVKSQPMCFYQYTSEILSNRSLFRTINFEINDNYAPDGGSNIFGDTGICEFGINITRNSVNDTSSISSNPVNVCLGADGIDCASNKSLTVYPGQEITLEARVVGEEKGAVSGTVSAYTIGGVAINDSEKAQVVDISGSNIKYTIYSSKADNPINGYLVLQPIKYGCSIAGYLVHSRVEISFSNCYFGFNNSVISSGAFACQCISNSVISSCSIQSQTITKRRYSWLGIFEVNNRSYLATNDFCPLDYCNSAFQDIKSLPDSLEQDEQCQYNRTGILCGSCPRGMELGTGKL